MSASPPETDQRYCAKFLNGPEKGNVILGLIKEPAERVVVFRSRIAAPGTLLCKPDDGEYFEGDLLYQKVSRSDLIDNPNFNGHPNIMAGCAYEFVDRPTPNITG